MSDERRAKQPFQTLGGRLKRSRVHSQESLRDASGAVEVDIEVLASIERGEQRPSEEILLLLISHFSIDEDEAADLWELAGYSEDEDKDEIVETKQTAFVLPMDIRVVYTDMVHVMVNDYGVVMNFIQNSGPNNQPLAVARVGMSREHAKSVVQILQQSLAQADQTPKSLPAPKARKRTDAN
jgi:transcriptional regulator with XRE-family HTH domain